MKGLKTCILIITIAFTFGKINGQNLVPNGSFETYSSLPNSLSDWSFCTGWNNVNMSMSTWPYATPDFYHTSGTGDAQLPNCKYGTVNPHTGNAIMGLYSRHSSQTNARDYIATQLSAPLVVGTTYNISFWITNGGAPYYYGSACNHFGIQLSMSPLNQNQHENIGGTPQAEIAAQHWSSNWVQYTFTYVATNPYQYVTIGNFNNDATTSTTNHASANYNAGVYYFIDDVVIEPTVVLPVSLIDFTAYKDGEHVKIEWQTEAEINNDYFTIEKSNNLIDWEEVMVVKGKGNSSNKSNYNEIDNYPFEGISYYRLKQTDYNGEFEYSTNRTVNFYDENEIKIYPNPIDNIFTIENTNNKEVKLVNLLGQNVDFVIINKSEDSVEIDISTLSKGVYVFFVGNSSYKIYKK